MERSRELPSTLTDLARAYRERRLSPVEIVETLLERTEAEDEVLNAFFTVTGERALRQAERAEQEIPAGEHRGALRGAPVGLKDLIHTRGVLTTMGCAFFADYVPERSATVAEKLEGGGNDPDRQDQPPTSSPTGPPASARTSARRGIRMM